MDLHKTLIIKLNQLQKLYKFLPETKCDNCGKCCNLTEEEKQDDYSVMIPLYLIEYLNLLQYIMKYYTTEKINECLSLREFQLEKCPFRDWENGFCSVYEVRPFICRSYGMLSFNQIQEAYKNWGEGVAEILIKRFLEDEVNLYCERLQVTEKEKLDKYMEYRINYKFRGTLASLSRDVPFLNKEQSMALKQVSGYANPLVSTWRGFNRLSKANPKWIKKNALKWILNEILN